VYGWGEKGFDEGNRTLEVAAGLAPLRFWPVYSYLIVYRPDAEPLAVVRVLSGSRDVAEILS
jgi:hypothetical protein